jgi:hypothetical protein
MKRIIRSVTATDSTRNYFDINSVSKNTSSFSFFFFVFVMYFVNGRCVSVYVICAKDVYKEKRLFINTILHPNS